jgi:iron complex outermembrane receptor protein
MNFSAARRSAPAFKPLALVSALSLCFLAFAARAEDTAQVLPAVTINGARFASDPALLPIGASVITADQIRRAGVTDVNQAIRKIGGVYGRQSLDSSPDFGLDLRGFGANSSQNMVITLDGVRMNENELSGPALSTIPIETIERIEIVRGGASVLFGEGATGGVIQIVTKRPSANGARGTLAAEAGQFGSHDVRASAARSWDGVALDAAIANQGGDNDRANNAFRQSAVSAGAQWSNTDGRVGLRVDRARQHARLPGSLTLAEFHANPHQTRTPADFGSLDSTRVSAFGEQRFGGIELAAELSHRTKTVKSHYESVAYGISDYVYESAQTQFSPRLRHLAQLDGMLNELVSGIDLSRWSRRTDSAYSNADAHQSSKAIYLRDELKWDAAHNGRLALGVRRELFDKDVADPIAYPAPLQERSVQGHNAWELQGSYDLLAKLNVYAKAGQSYRVANSDENGFRSSTAMLAVQSSHDLELGATWGDAAAQLTARLFRHNLVNEIFYDPTKFANTNLDPTRRQGFELEAQTRVAADWTISGHYQHVSAEFTAGPNSGREMVLVPGNVLSARLSWTAADGQSADFGAQWVDSQRYGDDFANSCSTRVPSYATFDARYARRIGAWEFALSGLNLADKQYFSNAFGCRSGIYPSDGRQLKLSARYDF